MRYLILAMLLVAGCGNYVPYERELARWYQRQMMWEKYQQVQRAKEETPHKKVEAASSAQLEAMWRAAGRNGASRIEDLAEDENFLRRWAQTPRRTIHVDLAPDIPRYDRIPRSKLKVGDEYFYEYPGRKPYRVRILYAKYRGTYGIVNLIKWQRVYSDGRRGPIETNKSGVFRPLNSIPKYELAPEKPPAREVF